MAERRAPLVTRVKICCISSKEEADLAIRYGAHALGFVSWMPSGAGVISDTLIRELAGSVPRTVRRFLLTCRRDAGEIADQVRKTGTDTVQLVDRMEPGQLQALRAALPDAELVQVVHVNGAASVAEAESVAPLVDYLLLDSGRPDAPNPELGGTGRTHDWATSAQIVRQVSVPVFLAGGLRPENVAEAINQVRPYGVDVCSRLRPDGPLDERLLAAFSAAVRNAGDGSAACE